MTAITLLSLASSQAFAQQAGKKGNSAATRSSQSSSSDTGAEAIINKEKESFEALKNKQYDVLDKNLADDFHSVSNGGIVDKNTKIAGYKKNNLSVTDYSFSDTKVTFPTNDTAIIIYKVSGKGSSGGQEFSETWNMSTVYVKRGGKWLAVHHTVAQANK